MKIEAGTLSRVNVLAALDEVGAGEIPADLPDDANLLEAGLLDSTRFMDLVALLEEWTGREIDFLEHDAAEMTSIEGVLAAFRTP